MPTSLLKDCSGAFSCIIANLANLSFKHGFFPSEFKTAQITPLLKNLESTPLSDIFEAFDAGESVLLVALDQSMAFDCIDHHTLLDRL